MYHSHNQKLNEMGEKAASLLQKMRGCLPASMSEGRKLETSMAREEIADVFACDQTTIRKNMMDLHGYEFTICGKCFAVCPYTQRYLKSE